MKKSGIGIVGLLSVLFMIVFNGQLVFADVMTPGRYISRNPWVIVVIIGTISIAVASIFIIRYIVRRAKSSSKLQKNDEEK